MSDNVFEISKLRKKREEINEAAQRTRKGENKLTRAELADALLSSTELMNAQHDLLQALTGDILKLVKSHNEMQAQQSMVSGQAYLALEILKEKGLATSDELQTRWEEIVRSKVEEIYSEPKERSNIIQLDKSIISP